MANAAYRKGRQFEYRCRDYFSRLGYLVVRSPQSRSPFDLLMIGPGEVFLVQCKVNGSLSPAAWNELLDLAKKVRGVAVLALRKKRKLLLYELIGWKNENGKRAPQPMVPIVIGELENARAPSTRKTRSAA